MVKLTMSTDGSENEFDSLASTKDKLKIQQRLIDISARNLQSTRLTFPSSLTSSSEAQSTIEENILLLENKLMRGFSRQLSLKHQYLKQVEEEEGESLKEAKKELDRWIDLEMFLNVADIEPRSVKALLGTPLSLDDLFTLPTSNLEQLLQKLQIPTVDQRKLLSYLDILTTFYEKWERGEKPSTDLSERFGSTTPSRLSSVSTLGSLDLEGRTDSFSSHVTYSSSSTIPTPLTPSSAVSFLSPTNHHPAVSICHSNSVFSTPNPSVPVPTLNRSYSSSSSMLLDESDIPSSANQNPLTQSRVGASQYNRRYTHTRSHSNPLANIVIHPEATSGQPSGNGGPNRSGIRSPSPPARAGSQPSMVSNSITGSPSSVHKNKAHPQMRRIKAQTPSFSQSVSNDQLGSMVTTAPHPQEYQSPFFRQNQRNEYAMPRCNSLAAVEQPRRSSSSQPYLGHEVTSASMVDLPMTTAASSEHLDQIDEYPLPKSGKSQSVPRLTLMTVSSESDRGIQSTSVPTSPRTPGTFTPTTSGRMGHAVMHRFSTKTFLTHHVCDYCKKSVMIGVKCKHCKYKCHRSCAPKAPHSCGLPRELMEYFRKHVLLTSSPSPSVENFVSPFEHNAPRPPMEKSNTYDSDRDFIIPDLTKEPKNGQFSPVMSVKKVRPENGRTHPFMAQVSSSSLLEVPHIPGSRGYRSTSSTPSPSVSPPTSPSLTPNSPQSPNDVYQYDYPSPQLLRTHRNTFGSTDDESIDGDNIIGKDLRLLSEDESRSCSPYSSKGNSINDISDTSPSPRGLRPPPQIVLAQSLPDLLLPHGRKSTESSDGSPTNLMNGYASDEYLQHQLVKRKESLLSTADSKTSTLVSSLPTEEDDFDSDAQGIPDDVPDYRWRRHRNSVVDEWNIPYSDIRIIETVGRGLVSEVYRGNWHGEVAIKRFFLPNPTAEQLSRFKEEVAILKKTRHENLALFMGASLVPPNLAIVSSFCKGQTLYRTIHQWLEPFPMEKCIHIAKQIAQALGYLHARGIVHKDLNSRNVFMDPKGKVVITDTGLTTLSDCIWIQQCGHCCAFTPRTKLYYLAPEIVRKLCPNPEVHENEDLYPYSEKSDIYAFGTILYELLTHRFPFAVDHLGFSHDATTIIFLVGRGERQEFHSREIPKRIKDLVWDCWHPQPQSRLPITTIWDILTKLSRKKTPISRSPSFPISLSRSTETLSVF